MTQTAETSVPNSHTVNEPAASISASNVHHGAVRLRLLTTLMVLFLLGAAAYGLFHWNPGRKSGEIGRRRNSR